MDSVFFGVWLDVNGLCMQSAFRRCLSFLLFFKRGLRVIGMVVYEIYPEKEVWTMGSGG
jgi:hypothetical protein